MRVSLPAEPILELLDAAAQRWDAERRPTSVSELARSVGVDPAGLRRKLERGRLDPIAADRLACAFGYHPLTLWPTEWAVWLESALPAHGTAARCKRGCRCVPCVEALQAYKRGWQLRTGRTAKPRQEAGL